MIELFQNIKNGCYYKKMFAHLQQLRGKFSDNDFMGRILAIKGGFLNCFGKLSYLGYFDIQHLINHM